MTCIVPSLMTIGAWPDEQITGWRNPASSQSYIHINTNLLSYQIALDIADTFEDSAVVFLLSTAPVSQRIVALNMLIHIYSTHMKYNLGKHENKWQIKADWHNFYKLMDHSEASVFHTLRLLLCCLESHAVSNGKRTARVGYSEVVCMSGFVLKGSH